MPRLEEREHKMKYFFISDSGRRMQKFSGDDISEAEIKIFDIPDFLLEHPPKNPTKNHQTKSNTYAIISRNLSLKGKKDEKRNHKISLSYSGKVCQQSGKGRS